jgi:hypothetical protein
MKIFASLLALLSFSSLASAENIQVWSNTYDYSCGYFSRRAADVSVTLQDETIPFGTTVNVIVGFGGDYASGGGPRRFANWELRRVVSATAIADSVWEARINDVSLHHRTEGRFLDHAQFVFEIKEPNADPRYVNGGSTWGYYQTSAMTSGVACVQNGNIPNNWMKLSVSVIEKN